jgi:flagellar M-ring protein FliF
MERKQIYLFSGIFAAVVVLLALAYFLLLRPSFAVLYEDIREADAAEIVAELDKAGIAYRLEDGGHRVLVPEDDVGRARVLVAGSGVAMGGVVGFELFNETDMGLTEFAQKVNFQRALQGELARTIMMMDGISFARVHLSLPERTLFNANQQGPRAAVTIQTESRRALGADRVSGIQELVASAVPELSAGHVAILDERGRLLSTGPVLAEDGELNEQQALEEYYRARVRGVAERLIPGMQFDVRVLAIGVDTAPAPVAEPAPGAAAPEQPVPSNERNFSLRIGFRTASALNPEDQQILLDAITEAAGLDSARGDILRFETGPLETPASPVTPMASPGFTADRQPLSPAGASASFSDEGLLTAILASSWFWIALVLMTLLVVFGLRGRARMSREEQQSFADLLSENLAMHAEPADGR